MVASFFTLVSLYCRYWTEVRCLQVRLTWGFFSSLFDIPLHETPFQASPSPILRVHVWRNKAVWKYSLWHNNLFRITAPNHKSTLSDRIILWASYWGLVLHFTLKIVNQNQTHCGPEKNFEDQDVKEKHDKIAPPPPLLRTWSQAKTGGRQVCVPVTPP